MIVQKLFFRLCLGIYLCSISFVFAASTTEIHLDTAPHRLNDLSALQRGAKTFVNYCIGCHSAAYVRYSSLRDLGLTGDQVEEYLLFNTKGLGDVMLSHLDAKDAKDWFGKAPPDLSLVARSRASSAGSGTDYLYTFLRGFYKDDSTPTGWNNTVFENTGMPHVLWDLQGIRELKESGDIDSGFRQVRAGGLTEVGYDNLIADLVAYMEWMAEPHKTTRIRIGVWVMLYLLVFLLVAWRLSASFWKDVK
jgi:ubiquinol-cytochrome c reductase cytochrome c1 subunit